jgi:type I restriction enzyme S subunit
MMPPPSGHPVKDSGMGWVGKIPSHWSIKPFYSFAEEVVHPNTGLKERNLLSLSYGRLVRKDIDRMEGLTPASFEGYNIIEANDIVFRLTDLQNDRTSLRSARAHEQGIITSAYVTVRPKSSPRFFEYLMRSYDTSKVFYGIGGGIRQSMKFADLKRIPVVVPPEDEMAEIASYLDRATARVDTLIAKKTRFIKLLTEKREALITHAVTKGVDAGVPMKDTGLDWLGTVPAHWKLGQLRRFTYSRCDGPFGSGLKSNNYTDDGARVIRLQNIGSGVYKANNSAYIGFEYWQDVLGGGHEVFSGDLLMAGLGDENNHLGRACVAPEGIEPALVKADCYRFRLTPDVDAQYVALTLSATARHECGFLANGATRDRLNLGLASSRVIPIPPLTEHKRIVSYISRSTARIDTLIAKTERSIELLREHRIALITAAVTGKLDLRNGAQEQ